MRLEKTPIIRCTICCAASVYRKGCRANDCSPIQLARLTSFNQFPFFYRINNFPWTTTTSRFISTTITREVARLVFLRDRKRHQRKRITRHRSYTILYWYARLMKQTPCVYQSTRPRIRFSINCSYKSYVASL